ncbi:efflux RND transporter periplasmic adaptor subunit [Pseudemcibacter aquimaris]|uniref:efflux RND transporter periplasmic adaptor subunit n=1 Tax=Pseudemcibacter aquimaris TaxID=2857064 RepID=UPI002011558B|nr:efflux RND transporter periplasmic adaptor subunit [Pseudemcibacter aquimaris]MCC3859835.1 efflux RND transporter periplasmic adaptor subunit [Pseudemcibacter aquimaris]WDU57167.1 efflux RND transporter periplasmic adaptor subunit [Pseudemcibacter aquimaris]
MTEKNTNKSSGIISAYGDSLKKNPKLTIAASIFLVVVGGLAATRTGEIIGRASAAVDSVDVANALTVSTVTAEQTQNYQTVQYVSGQVMAARESDHGFDRSGVLAEVLVDEGDRVKKGDILAKLDIRKLNAQHNQFKADLESAKAFAVEAKTNQQRAKAAYDRYSALKDSGHISQHRLDQAETDLASANAGVTSAMANIQKIEAALVAVNADIDLATLSAKFDGTVVKRYRDEGASFGMGGGPMIRLIEDGKLEIRVGLTENAATSMEQGAKYTFAQNGRDINTTLRSIVGQVDQNTRTISAIFDIDPGQNVIPGTLAEIAVNVNVNETGYWLPTEALAESRRGLWTAYTLSPFEGRSDVSELKRQELQVLYTEADRVYVRGTLSDGDQVVSSGTHRLSSGFIVKAN